MPYHHLDDAAGCRQHPPRGLRESLGERPTTPPACTRMSMPAQKSQHTTETVPWGLAPAPDATHNSKTMPTRSQHVVDLPRDPAA